MGMQRLSSFTATLWLGFLLFSGSGHAGESLFDPPLEGIFLGIGGESRRGTVLVTRIQPGSAAERSGLRSGDQILRLNSTRGFQRFEDFAATVGALKIEQSVELGIRREDRSMTLTLVPDPAIFRDYFQLLDHLERSRFLRSRDSFNQVMQQIRASVPDALRRARRSSEAYEILNRALGRLGTSHTAIVPPRAYKSLLAGEVDGGGGYGTGLVLEKVEEKGGASYFVAEILDGSPAEIGGVLTGDQIVRVDGVEIHDSPRLSLAGYEASRFRYALLVDEGESLALDLRHVRGGQVIEATLDILEPTSGLDASEASMRRLERDGRLLAYLHLWNLLSPKLLPMVRDVLARDRGFAEALLLDLRGRGGQVEVLRAVADLLKDDPRPLALLLDRESRSAKEILACQLKGRPNVILVGERTAGAVLPGHFVVLPGGARVMLPMNPGMIRRLTDGRVLEGVGVEPDLKVERAGRYSAGSDPILEAGIRALLDKLSQVPRMRRL